MKHERLFQIVNLLIHNKVLTAPELEEKVGVEFMPSLLVPYEIPKDKKTAFITCVYLSDDKYDYKSAPLRKLEEYLRSTYDRVLVISDETGVFPNGNKAFFEKNGYTDNGIISHEEGYCTLHLMSKSLSLPENLHMQGV